MKERKPNGYWKDWNNVEEELKEAIKENNGDFPTRNRLKEMGKSGLNSSITKYHRGFRIVREKMGQGQIKRPEGYWKIW